MQINIAIRSNRFFVLLFMSFVLLGCDKGSDLTRGQSSALLKEKRANFVDILEVCKNEKQIEFVSSRIDNDEEVSRSDQLNSDISRIRRNMTEIGAVFVSCSHKQQRTGFGAASFTLFSSGLSVAGTSVALFYYEPGSDEENQKTKENLLKSGAELVEYPSWYYVRDES